MSAVFRFVADEEHAEEARVAVEAINAHGVVVIPESGGVLLEGIGADAGFAGHEPVFGVAVVFGGDFGAVDVDDGADVGDVVAAAVEGVVDGEKMLGGEVVDPLDLEGMVGAGLDDGTEGCGAVAPHAGGFDVAMDLMMDLTHGDAEFLGIALRRAGVFAVLRQWQRVHEGRQLENVKHGSRLARSVGHLLGHGLSWIVPGRAGSCRGVPWRRLAEENGGETNWKRTTSGLR